jgi:hypothetical protein
MKKILLIIFLLASVHLFAQDVKISGTVTAAGNNEPLSGASINVKEKIAGTTTNSKGQFTLLAGKIRLPFTIVITAVGYDQQEVVIKSESQTVSASLPVRTTHAKRGGNIGNPRKPKHTAIAGKYRKNDHQGHQGKPLVHFL